ncbi:hypothetical protein ABPG74_005639 [Tetrahymena malaccensis]
MSDRLIFSTQPELLRLNQKDEEYGFGLFQKLIDALEIFTPKILSYRFISTNQDTLKIFSFFAYYILTTISNRKTLGEEFCNLHQFNKQDFDFKGIPTSLKRRILFVILTTLSPFIFKKLVKKQYDQSREMMMAERKEYRGILASIIRNLPNYDGIYEKIIKFHLCMFFLDGLFVQISKRISGIYYVFQKQPQNHNITYKKVGVLVAIQLAIEFARYGYRVYQDYQQSKQIENQINSEFTYKSGEDKNENQHEEEEEQIDIPQELLCALCYDKRKITSATPCGHLFCWDCIIKSTQIKPECPSCRQACLPQKIVQIVNFK